LTVIGWSAVTGAGFTDQTMQNLSKGMDCHGKLAAEVLSQGLPPGMIRRLKRLSQMALALLLHSQTQNKDAKPKSVFFGTGWGSLSETNDFLKGLFDSEEKFSSPTDFIGSVHNAAAGQIALMTQATGANITLSGGDYSFEQALFCAQMLTDGDAPVLVAGADETHEKLSPLFDPSVTAGTVPSEGGGALILKRTHEPVGPRVALRYFATDFEKHPDMHDLVTHLGGGEVILSKYGLILAGLPAAQRSECQKQLDRFIELTGYPGTIIDYRNLTGEFATSAAVATVFAAVLVHKDLAPLSIPGGSVASPHAKAALILGLGSALTAVEVCPA
jgi:hypothetical protein